MNEAPEDTAGEPELGRRPSCANCGRPAVVLLGDYPACIDCNYKFDMSQWMKFAQNAAMLNYLDREIMSTVGMPHLSNQIAIPRPPVPPINYNNQSVSVSGGTVGSINFGNVREIQVNLQTLSEGVAPDIVQPLSELTDAILNAADADEPTKNELLEQIATLTALAASKPEERKQGTIKALFGAIKEGAGAVTGAAGAWQAVEPLLRGHLGL